MPIDEQPTQKPFPDILIIIGGIFAGILIIVGAIYCYWKFKKQENQNGNNSQRNNDTSRNTLTEQ